MALAEGLLQANVCEAADITITRRTTAALESLHEKGFVTSTDNADAIKEADAIFICVLPH